MSVDMHPAAMQYAQIPGVDVPVSRIFYGTAAPPMAMGGACNELLDAMFAQGVTAYDTARNYMAAEKSLGQWIESRGNRDKIVILSKCAHPSIFGRKRVNEKDIRKDFHKSAQFLHTEYIDLYLLHRDDPEVPVGEVVEIMNALYAEGKIRAYGASNWTHTRIAEANEYADAHHLLPMAVSSPNFGLAAQVQDPWGGGCVTISGPENAEARSWYAQKQMPVIAYSSLGRGLFSGKLTYEKRQEASKYMDGPAMLGYGHEENFERLRRCEILAAQKHCLVPQLAMAWIFQQPLNAFAVVSTSSPERMAQNIQALSIALTPEELAYLDLQREEPV